MSDAPKCKLCGVKHWLGEPHVTRATIRETVISSSHVQPKDTPKEQPIVRPRGLLRAQRRKRLLPETPRRVSTGVAQGENAGTQGTEEPTRFDWVKRAQELGL